MTAQVTQQGQYRGTQDVAADLMAVSAPGLLHRMWYRIRFTVQEMNYASLRMASLQTPGFVDEQRRGR